MGHFTVSMPSSANEASIWVGCNQRQGQHVKLQISWRKSTHVNTGDFDHALQRAVLQLIKMHALLAVRDGRREALAEDGELAAVGGDVDVGLAHAGQLEDGDHLVRRHILFQAHSVDKQLANSSKTWKARNLPGTHAMDSVPSVRAVSQPFREDLLEGSKQALLDRGIIHARDHVGVLARGIRAGGAHCGDRHGCGRQSRSRGCTGERTICKLQPPGVMRGLYTRAGSGSGAQI